MIEFGGGNIVIHQYIKGLSRSTIVEDSLPATSHSTAQPSSPSFHSTYRTKSRNHQRVGNLSHTSSITRVVCNTYLAKISVVSQNRIFSSSVGMYVYIYLEIAVE